MTAGTGAPLDYGVVRRLQAQVADRMTATKQHRDRTGQVPLGREDERQLALSFAHDAVAQHMQAQIAAGRELPDSSYDVHLVEAIDAAMFGAGALQALLDHPEVENIDINGCDEVWVTYADGRTVRERPVAATDDELADMVRNLGAYAGVNARPFTPATPELDLRLPDGSRLSAIMVASERPAVSIRRNRFPQMFLDQVPAQAEPVDGHRPATLLQLGTVDEQLAAFLRAAVVSRCNIVVAGATDAGKTTLLRALINCIPAQERLITVERALELGLRRHPHLHPNVVEMEEVLPAPDGGGGVSIGQLVRRTRRQNPSRVIVGEVLGPEVVEMLSAMSQGNDGSLSTIHARDAADVFGRLATYAAQHEGLSFEVSHALIGSTIDFVVFVRKNPRADGRRMVMEVLEVIGSAHGGVTRSRIFVEGRDGRAVRDPEVPIARLAQLAEAGYDDAPVWPVGHAHTGPDPTGYGGNGYGPHAWTRGR
ncbi:MAG TPA: ATPase, T2SS/T4P/T4SS family [Kineosporiaceae bacterium]|nr:ATPase, T2SS/T4P/T4SS family [Kineosporiaceae bacterium]